MGQESSCTKPLKCPRCKQLSLKCITLCSVQESFTVRKFLLLPTLWCWKAFLGIDSFLPLVPATSLITGRERRGWLFRGSKNTTLCLKWSVKKRTELTVSWNSHSSRGQRPLSLYLLVLKEQLSLLLLLESRQSQSGGQQL